MNLLAVDAASDRLTVAVERAGRVYRASRGGAKAHDEQLWPAVESALKRARLRLEELDAVAAAAGPGRFTGIRIGLSFAASLGYALDIPALALSRLEAAAEKLPGAEVRAALPGWKGEVYHQRFKRGRGGALKALGAAEWASPQGWGGGAAPPETDAADLLPVMRRALGSRKRPPFAPFYLKPAGYEKNRR